MLRHLTRFLFILALAFFASGETSALPRIRAPQNELAGQKLAPRIFSEITSILRHLAASQAAELQQEKSSAVENIVSASPLAAESGAGKLATTVYRVEGVPNTRIIIGEGGQVAIQGDEMLFLNFGDKARAEQFLAKRVSQGMQGAEVKTFEVPKSFLEELKASAVPESMAKEFPNSPLLVDPTKAANQFGLRPEQIEALKKAINQGTGKAGGG